MANACTAASDMKLLVAQSCLTLYNPMDCSSPGPSAMEFSRQEYWNGPFLSPGDLPDPGIEPRSPVLQADALPSEPTKGEMVAN